MNRLVVFVATVLLVGCAVEDPPPNPMEELVHKQSAIIVSLHDRIRRLEEQAEKPVEQPEPEREYIFRPEDYR